MKKIKLSEVIDAIECMMDEYITCYNKETNKIISVSEESMRIAEDLEPETEKDELEMYSDWEQEEILSAYDITYNWHNYISLPSKFDINEYEIMSGFCATLETKEMNILFDAIRGRGAFRRFKDKIHELGVDQKWYSYKDQRIKEIAIEWCKNYGLCS